MHTARPPIPRWAQMAPLAGLALLTGLAFAPQAQAAGPVQLSFVQPEQFIDIGRSSFDREHNLRVLATHFQRLGQALPEGQQLQIEVLDVDLAGEVWPRASQEVRVMRGGLDWPRISLRYTLKAGETVLAQGEDRLSDASYLFPRRRALEHQPLPFERRMVDTWFQERFAGTRAAAAR